jgi:hypothetical protein
MPNGTDVTIELGTPVKDIISFRTDSLSTIIWADLLIEFKKFFSKSITLSTG